MIVHQCEQGSDAWLALRAGVITASEIDNVLTPKTLKPASGKAYFKRVIAERVWGRPVMSEEESKAMGRGKALEPEAREWYDEQHGFVNGPVVVAGFVTTDDGRVGCSPDALCGDDGGLEIKCPMLDTHVGYMIDPDELRADYRGQVQTSLFVTGRKWWDLCSYNPAPEFPPVVVRCLPDEAYHAALSVALTEFIRRVDDAVVRLGCDLATRRLTNPFLI